MKTSTWSVIKLNLTLLAVDNIRTKSFYHLTRWIRLAIAIGKKRTIGSIWNLHRMREFVQMSQSLIVSIWIFIIVNVLLTKIRCGPCGSGFWWDFTINLSPQYSRALRITKLKARYSPAPLGKGLQRFKISITNDTYNNMYITRNATLRQYLNMYGQSVTISKVT